MMNVKPTNEYTYAVTCDECGAFCSPLKKTYSEAIANTYEGTIHNGHYNHFCSKECSNKRKELLK